MKKITAAIIAAGIMLSGRTWAEVPKVSVNGDTSVYSTAYIKGGQTYVPVRSFFESQGINVKWADSHIKAGEHHIYNFEVNDNVSYAPLRDLSQLADLEVSWDGEQKLAQATSGEYRENSDLYWLARIIHAESEGEPRRGKIAVGNVVMNRVRSKSYPDSVYGVVFDMIGGVQFTPVKNGRIYKKPSAESIEAARAVLAGENVAGDALFFFNPKTAQSQWIAQNRVYFITIDNHDFYL